MQKYCVTYEKYIHTCITATQMVLTVVGLFKIVDLKYSVLPALPKKVPGPVAHCIPSDRCEKTCMPPLK